MNRKNLDKFEPKEQCFEVQQSQYNPVFVAEIREIEKEVAEGRVTRLDPNKSIWENLRSE